MFSGLGRLANSRGFATADGEVLFRESQVKQAVLLLAPTSHDY